MDRKREHMERTTAVTMGEMRMIAVYQPVWYDGRAPVELYRREMERKMTMCLWKTTLVKGGDHDSQVGGGTQRDEVSRKFELCTATDEAGKDLLQWCEVNNKALVNSFMKHQNRGTWLNNIWMRWYELDGFIMRQDQRHKKK